MIVPVSDLTTHRREGLFALARCLNRLEEPGQRCVSVQPIRDDGLAACPQVAAFSKAPVGSDRRVTDQEHTDVAGQQGATQASPPLLGSGNGVVGKKHPIAIVQVKQAILQVLGISLVTLFEYQVDACQCELRSRVAGGS